MAKEIERKFLVAELPASLSEVTPKRLEQGYLALEPDGNEVRLRRSENQFWLTIKTQGALIREEYEVELSEEQFEQLWPGTEGRRLVKNRYINVFNGFKVELDVYEKPLKGLIVAEIEFPSPEVAESFQKADWMEKELTHINFLKNRNLLHFDSFEAIKDRL